MQSLFNLYGVESTIKTIILSQRGLLERAFRQSLGDGTHVVSDLLPAVQKNHRGVFMELEVHEHLKRVYKKEKYGGKKA